MQLKLANVFRRERHEGRGEAVVLSTPGRGTERIFIDCVTRTSARVLVQCPSRRFKVPSPSLLPCLCHFLWLQEGYEGLAKEASQPRSYRVLNFSLCLPTNSMIFLITSGFKSVSYYFLPVPTQSAAAQRKEPSTFKGCNCTHSITQLRMGFGR